MQAEGSFSPEKHGFRFPNTFSQALDVEYPIPQVGSIDLADVLSGLSGGMCFAALDYYLADLPVPGARSADVVEPAFLRYLRDRQLDSLPVDSVLRMLEWMLLEDAQLAQKMSRSEIAKLRRRLDRGKPAVLALVRTRTFLDRPKNGMLVAARYEMDPASRAFTIYGYDPDKPGEETLLQVRPAPRLKDWRLELSGGEPVRGFFVVPYIRRKNPYQPAEQAIRAVFAAEEARVLPFRLRWPVDSHRVNQYFAENPDSYRPFGLPGHEGLDLYAVSGANIYSAAAGEVYQAGFPKNHPYGRHIRIRHQAGGKTFHTIYGHLSEVYVQVGQRVSAGERIGLADNTGNSFGSHLHLTLKIDGERTPGYPAGIVDPWPFLQESDEPEPAVQENLPPLSGVTVFTSGEVNLRAQPNTNAQVLALIPAGEILVVLGDAEEARNRIGLQGQWLQVLTAGSLAGYVAAWLVTSSEQAFPPSDLVIYPFDALNLRVGPGTAFPTLVSLASTDALTVLGDATNAQQKIGKEGEWLQVQTQAGLRGFVAAWLVHRTGEKPPQTGLVVFPTDLVNLRARPALDGNILSVVGPGDALTVLGDENQARQHMGQPDQWLNVQAPNRQAGYVAAWLVSTVAARTNEPPVTSLEAFATADVNVRAQPSQNAARVGGLSRGERLKVIETDLQAAKEKIGAAEQWVYGRGPRGEQGWVAGWLLSRMPVQ